MIGDDVGVAVGLKLGIKACVGVSVRTGVGLPVGIARGNTVRVGTGVASEGAGVEPFCGFKCLSGGVGVGTVDGGDVTEGITVGIGVFRTGAEVNVEDAIVEIDVRVEIGV